MEFYILNLLQWTHIGKYGTQEKNMEGKTNTIQALGRGRGGEINAHIRKSQGQETQHIS